MINDTKNYPLGWTKQTIINIGEWDHDDWRSKEKMMIYWLENYSSNGKFSWERPAYNFIFDDEKDATMFILRWA